LYENNFVCEWFNHFGRRNVENSVFGKTFQNPVPKKGLPYELADCHGDLSVVAEAP
jgi:hypothetical protein